MKIAIAALLVIMGLAIGAAFLAGPGAMSSLAEFKSEARGTPVRIQALKPDSLVEFVSAPGDVEPHTKVEISSQVSARIVELPFREGEAVSKGDVIVRLDDRDLRAALDAAKARRDGEEFRLRAEQARLEGLRATLSYARKQRERKQTLYESGDISIRELDEELSKVEDLEASVDASSYNISVSESSLVSARADIDRAEDAVEKCVITAPMDGLIIVLNNEVGEQVLGTFNNIGSQIMTIADLSRMLVKAEVAESDIAGVKDGQQAEVHLNAYPDDTFAGTVTHIALQRTMSTDGSGIFEVEVELDLQGRRIRSGLAANVDIEVAVHEGLIVESQAIVERLIDDLPEDIRRLNPLVDRAKRTTEVVYRLVDGKAVCTPVHSGASNLTDTVILEGVDEGDLVVVGPYKVLEKIKHGEAIRDEALDDAGKGEEAGNGERMVDDGDDAPAPEPTPREAT